MILTSVNSETTNSDSESNDSEDLDFYNERDTCDERLSDNNLEVTAGIHHIELFDIFPIFFILLPDILCM